MRDGFCSMAVGYPAKRRTTCNFGWKMPLQFLLTNVVPLVYYSYQVSVVVGRRRYFRGRGRMRRPAVASRDA
jgi:hypothetical protein